MTIWALFIGFEKRALKLVEDITSGSRWAIKATAVILGLALFLSFPSYDSLNFDEHERGVWNAVILKSRDLTLDLSEFYSPGSNPGKVNFRLTGPLIGHFLRLDIFGFVVVQAIAGALLIYFSVLLTNNITKDRVVAFLTTLLIGATYAGIVSFAELRGRFDGLGICFLVAALLTRRPILITLFVLLAAWTDERGLVASPLVLLFHLLNSSSGREFRVKDFLKPQLLSVYLAWVLYFATRFLYAYALDLPQSYRQDGFHVLFRQINMIPMGLWTAFEAGWLLILLAFIVLAIEKRWAFSLLFIAALSLLFTVALGVVDISRTTAFAVPALYIAVRILKNALSTADLRRYSLVACLGTMFWPTYYAGGVNSIWWVYPLPFQILRFVLAGLGISDL